MTETYPLNYEHTSDFIVAPQLAISGVKLAWVPCNKMLGFDFIQTCDEFCPIFAYPTPVAIDCGGFFDPIPDSSFLKPDLNGIKCSHIFCLLISQDTSEIQKQQLISTLSTIHPNRTLDSREELIMRILMNDSLRDNISSAYGIDPIEQHSRLLLSNNFSDKHLQRLIQKAHWNKFALAHGIMTFAEIIDAIPVPKRQKTRQWLYKRIMQHADDLGALWEVVSERLQRNVQ
jgi:hypothetical protein